MYVAITRAREKLYLTRSKSRYLYGRREPTARSTFIDELKTELGIADRPVYNRYSGDYESGEYGGRRYGGYGNYGGAVRRVGSYSESKESEAFTTFGGSKKPPVRFGGVGMSEVKPPETPQKDTAGFQVGVRVRHTRFGEGTVQAVRGEGRSLIITVHFQTVGNKDLAAALAPLEILG